MVSNFKDHGKNGHPYFLKQRLKQLLMTCYVFLSFLCLFDVTDADIGVDARVGWDDDMGTDVDTII
jgi:hypothetical protein